MRRGFFPGLLFLSACGSVDPALTPGMDPAQTDYVYQNAYADGCRVGQNARTGALDEEAYTHALTNTGPRYRVGWTDGFETCPGQKIARQPRPAEPQDGPPAALAGTEPARTSPRYRAAYADGCAFARAVETEGTIDLRAYEKGITQAITARREGWIDGIETCFAATLGPAADAAHAERVATWRAKVNRLQSACRANMSPKDRESLAYVIWAGPIMGSQVFDKCRTEAAAQAGPRPPDRFTAP